ncbi:hypothetical protein PBI_DEWDROP_7 [Microbacterium phage Dewdrop]|nr:hypothetical protein PBI_LEAF_7 [Microbacterium phage Leaf]QGZ17376.1 hypothetical protein PBI_DEWDROP_7 [Microbacterium phage Dewdrop]
MGFWERLRLRMALSALRGREQKLHSDIAGGYARGQYLAKARQEQNEVRRQIRVLAERLGE